MLFWLVLSATVLPHIEYTYQQVYYVKQKGGANHRVQCSTESYPCESLQYVLDNYTPSDGIMSIQLKDGSYSLKDTTIDCGARRVPIRRFEIHPFSSSNATFFMDNVFVRDCYFGLESVLFQFAGRKSTDIDFSSSVLFTNSQVNYSRVTFMNVEHKINLLHSNLSMVDINYEFSEQGSHHRNISNTPVVSAFSNTKHKPNNYVVLKNWIITFGKSPLVVAHECFVELNNIMVRHHNNAHPNGFPLTKPPHLISLYNAPRVTLNKVILTNSEFYRAIFYIENFDRNTVLITELAVVNSTIRSTGEISSVILENKGGAHLDLNEISVDKVAVGALLQIDNQSSLSPIQKIKINPSLTVSCNAGFYVAYGSCLPCPSGPFQAGNKHNANSCVPCPPGTFSEHSGQTLCQDCQPGTYCSHEGCTKCDFCNTKISTSRRQATGCYILPTVLYVIASISLGLILLPSLILVIIKSRKSRRRKFKHYK